MSLPQLNAYRHDRGDRALITLAGEIDLDTVPLVRASVEKCLREGIRVIDVDLTTVTFCDVSALNAFLVVSQQTVDAGGAFRLHHPPPVLARVVDLTGSQFLVEGLPFTEHRAPLPSWSGQGDRGSQVVRSRADRSVSRCSRARGRPGS
ncbi:STAS domain-containing protein [Streptomyces sp. NPDC058657]|uniref:STAS domain-containing protein n=1 Tax=unclassified Streptomyces TaxID=2593676 RepID=UPI0036693AC3